jgi:hypothetical protein
MRVPALLPISVFAATLCLGGGCSSLPESEDAAAGEVGALVRFEPLLTTTASCHGTGRSTAALRDASAWQAWWTEVSCTGEAPPAVDFTGSLVLAVQDREGPTGCYQVRIAEVRTGVGGGYRVVVHRHVPERSRPCPMVIVHPAIAVRVPAARGPVVFEWRTVEGPAP